MTQIIKDGTGTGHTVKVDDQNRAHTLATTKTIREDAILRGELFAHNTDFINLTTDTVSGIFYLKNESDQDLFIEVTGTDFYSVNLAANIFAMALVLTRNAGKRMNS